MDGMIIRRAPSFYVDLEQDEDAVRHSADRVVTVICGDTCWRISEVWSNTLQWSVYYVFEEVRPGSYRYRWQVEIRSS